MKTYAAVLAAGSGVRFGADKVALRVRGKPIWKYSFETLQSHPLISGVGLVVREGFIDFVRGEAPEALFVVAGGASRQESSRAALSALPRDADAVLIHDGARPLVTAETIERVVLGTLEAGAAAPFVPIVDTVRLELDENRDLVVRENLRSMQTPQGIRVNYLRLAMESDSSLQAVDEFALAESVGLTPRLVEGSASAVKLTHPADLARLAGFLEPPESRTGIGYDVHRFSTDPNRPLWLGGVRFAGEVGLEGHSDADAVIHAVVDALLGAAALGDIGLHFPNTDPRWKDAPSRHFLNHAGQLLREFGWKIRNIDITVLAERPKILGRAVEMKKVLGEALDIEPSRIGLKATTNEGLGAIGRGEGIAAIATATIIQSP